MAGTTGLEPAASAVTGQRSNQLNYVPTRSQRMVGNPLNSRCLPGGKPRKAPTALYQTASTASKSHDSTSNAQGDSRAHIFHGKNAGNRWVGAVRIRAQDADIIQLCGWLLCQRQITMNLSILKRLAGLDWTAIRQSLWEFGYALTPAVLTKTECLDLAEMYSSATKFRSHIIMSRYRFGRGDYKYFDYPLPPVVQELREHSYSYLAPLANEWNKALGTTDTFPADHSAFLKICKAAGQTRATPLVLHYEAGDFNCLHQDIYGAVAFPLQLTCFLSQPGADYEGGEFVLVEQQPRAQSKD